MLKLRFVLLSLLSVCLSAFGQSSISTAFTLSSANQTGTPENGSFEGTLENVNLQNGNVSIAVPLLHLPGVAGLDLDLKLLIDSKVWTMVGGLPPYWDSANQRTEYTAPNFHPAQTPQVSFAGGHLNIPFLTSKPVNVQTTSYDGMGIPTTLLAVCQTGFTLFDMHGAAHGFSNFSGCVGDAHPNDPEVTYTESSDGSFYRLDTTNTSDIIAYDRSGLQYHFGGPDGWSGLVKRIVDPSGNAISFSWSGSYSNPVYTITDTSNRTVTVTPSSISYYDSAGGPRTINVSYTDLGPQGTVQFTLVNGHASDGGGWDYVSNQSGTHTYTNEVTKYVVSLPTGEQYGLTYSGFNEIAKVDYPSGGYTSYTYQSIPGAYIDSNWTIFADLRELHTRSVCPKSNGSCASNELLTTTYTPYSGGAESGGTDGNVSNEVLDPIGNLTHVDFWGGAGAMFEKQRYIYSGNGDSKQLLRTIAYGYAWNGVNYSPSSCNPNPISITTTLNDISPALTSRVEFDYQSLSLDNDPHGMYECGTSAQSPNVIAKREYGYDGALIRTTTNSWLSYSTSAPHLLDRQTSSTVTGGGINSTHVWDYTATGLVQDEIVSGTNANNSTITYGHDSNGRVTSVQDARLNSTTYDYTPVWANTTSACPVTLSASPTTTTDALNHSSHATFDACTGTLHSSQDVNGNTTTFQYDARMRSAGQSNPDGGGTQITYGSGAGTSVTTSQRLDSRSITGVIVHDGIGRKLTAQNLSDPNGTVSVDYTYAPLGGVASISNPHYGGGGSQFTTYAYDALSRPRTVTNPDGSIKQQTYTGNVVKVCDEASSCRNLAYDALGRLGSVTELTSQNSGITTTYAYDALNNLKNVNQNGSLTRSFTYNGRSQLLTASNPETGTVCYGLPSNGSCVGGYDPNGNLLYKTDARGVAIAYTYDVLNRLTSKTYSDGTPAAHYVYDTAPGWGGPFSTNLIGHLVQEYTEQSSGMYMDRLFDYDVMGRVTHIPEALQSEAGHGGHFTHVRYDLAGNPVGITYPDGTAITNTYDSAGRLSGVYAGTPAVPGVQYVGIQYYPDGTAATTTYGNGVVETRSENSRLQTCRLQVSRSGMNYLDRSYAFTPSNGGNCGAESNNNGNIWQITDNLPGSPYSQAMQYDSLNRLTSWDAPNFANAVRHINYTYDSFGNMVSNRGYAPTATDVGTVNARPFPNASYNTSVWPYDGNNRLQAGTFDCVPAGGGASFYDLAGNVLCDGSNTNLNARQYRWDGDSRIAEIDGQPGSANTYYKTAGYAYDPEGLRVRAEQYAPPSTTPTSWREYAYLNGQVLAEHDQSGAWTDYIIANGKRIARIALASSVTSLTGFHFQGNSTSVGYQGLDAFAYNLGRYSTGQGIADYVIQAGDTLEWQQYSNNVNGGFKDMYFYSCGGTYSLTDTNGVRFDHSPAQNAWTTRVVDLSGYVGCPIQVVSVQGTLLQAGHWDLWISDLKIRHADGTTIVANSTVLPTKVNYDPNATGVSVAVEAMAVIVSPSTSLRGFHFQGNSTSLGYQGLDAFLYNLGRYSTGQGIADYVIQAGDTLEWQQYSNNVNGGFKLMYFYSCGGTYQLTDTNGVRFDHSPTQNSWTTRVVDLSGYVGCPIQITSVQGSLLQAGHWDLWISGLKIRHADGTTIMANSTTLPTNYGNDLNETGASVALETITIPGITVPATASPGTPVPTTTYTITDHLNTASLEFSDAGTLVWQGAFAPFGQELDNNPNFNRYKFTGKERDAESGLDYFGARYYGASMGRFMSPDWSAKVEPIPYSKLEDPQSFNLYAYVAGNPVTRIDPDGHKSCEECRAIISAIMDLGNDSADVLWAANQARKESSQRAQQQVSQAGQDFIKGYEKLSLMVYDASKGKVKGGDWTIGYGHKTTKDAGPITLKQAEALFQGDVARMASHVSADLNVPVSQNQFDALVSLRFNAGANAITPPVADLNNTGHATMGDFTKHYITAGGVPMRGLELRRAAEWRIFSEGVYDASH